MHRCQHSFKKFLQIYELFAKDPTVSKEFPMLASPRLYLVILSNIWYSPLCAHQICYWAKASTIQVAFERVLGGDNTTV